MNAKTVLLLSLTVNVALAAALVWTARSKAPQTDVTEAPNIAPATNALKRLSARAATAPSVDPAAAPGQLFDWRLVESEDYRKYIANLRAIGCPEETIRDIIVADVNKLYESRRKELAGPPKKFEYWKPGAMMGATYDAERTEKERALNQEKRALLTELLGSAPDEKPDLLAGAAGQLEAMFDFLPAAKRSKVFDLMQDMQGRMQKATRGGAPDTDDIRKAMKDTEAALAEILSPEELLDYNLRFSMTANMMRMQLAGYEPTEQEFLELFKKRKAYDDEYGVGGMGVQNLKGEEKEKQKAAEQKLDDEIKSMLGDQRYQEYKRAQDYNFQAMYRVAERENLGKDAAVKAYEMKKAAEDEARKLRTDTSLTREQRTTALAGIRAETEKGMRTVFGEKGFESYQNQNQAYWLNTISPEPKPPAKSP
jgi:hypothetical protein